MTDLTEVKGIGPATAVKLHGAGIRTAEALARAEIDHLVQIIGRTTATKIIKNAKDLLGDLGVEIPAESPVEVPVKEEKVETTEEEVVEITTEEELEGDLTALPGIGPKTQKDLISAGFNDVDKIAKASVKDLTNVEGVGKKTAETIITSAQELLGIEPAKEEVKKEKPPKKVETKKVVEEDSDSGIRTEHESSPTPQGIPTKKKRGVQISSEVEKIDLDELDSNAVDEKSGWKVKAKELSEEEREARRLRQEMLRASERITRDIPKPPEPVKAVKEAKRAKSEKPVKKERKAKSVQQQVKKTKEQKKEEMHVDYYTNKDLHPIEIYGRPKISGESSGKKQPRIELDRDTFLGRITSKRRSRRNINNRQVIVDLHNGFEPEQLVGQKVYFTYSEGKRVSGSITKRFGKKSSGKVLVQFKKGLREDAIFQKIYIY